MKTFVNNYKGFFIATVISGYFTMATALVMVLAAAS